MNKKNLQIDTNIYDDPDMDVIYVTDSEVHAGEKVESAAMFEKILSCILARHFIECWNQLRIFYYSGAVNKRFQNSQSKRAQFERSPRISSRDHLHPSKKYPQKRYRTRSQRYSTEQVQRQDDTYFPLRKNKSARSINPSLAYSRANVLKGIVDKLKSQKKGQTHHYEVEVEVLKKLNYLQKMIRDLQDSTGIHVIKQNQEESSRDGDEVAKTISRQIENIRQEIKTIRENNEQIINHQIKRVETKVEFEHPATQRKYEGKKPQEPVRIQPVTPLNFNQVNQNPPQPVYRPLGFNPNLSLPSQINTEAKSIGFQPVNPRPVQLSTGRNYPPPYQSTISPVPTNISIRNPPPLQYNPSLTNLNKNLTFQAPPQNKTATNIPSIPTMPTYPSFTQQTQKEAIHYRNPSIQIPPPSQENLNSSKLPAFCDKCGRSFGYPPFVVTRKP